MWAGGQAFAVETILGAGYAGFAGACVESTAWRTFTTRCRGGRK